MAVGQQAPGPFIDPSEGFLVVVHGAGDPVALLIGCGHAGPGDRDYLPDRPGGLASGKVRHPAPLTDAEEADPDRLRLRLLLVAAPALRQAGRP